MILTRGGPTGRQFEFTVYTGVVWVQNKTKLWSLKDQKKTQGVRFTCLMLKLRRKYGILRIHIFVFVFFLWVCTRERTSMHACVRGCMRVCTRVYVRACVWEYVPALQFVVFASPSLQLWKRRKQSKVAINSVGFLLCRGIYQPQFEILVTCTLQEHCIYWIAHGWKIYTENINQVTKKSM